MNTEETGGKRLRSYNKKHPSDLLVRKGAPMFLLKSFRCRVWRLIRSSSFVERTLTGNGTRNMTGRTRATGKRSARSRRSGVFHPSGVWRKLRDSCFGGFPYHSMGTAGVPIRRWGTPPFRNLPCAPYKYWRNSSCRACR